MHFLKRAPHVFQGIFHREGGLILTNQWQKMYAKFNFLHDGASRVQLAQKATELQLVCDSYHLFSGEEVHFMKRASF